MNHQPWNGPTVHKPEEKLPDEDVRVIVLCSGFRCLGYLHKGVWLSEYGGGEIKEVIGWAA